MAPSFISWSPSLVIKLRASIKPPGPKTRILLGWSAGIVSCQSMELWNTDQRLSFGFTLSPVDDDDDDDDDFRRMSCYMLLYIFNKNEENLIELQPSADHQTRSLLGAWPRTGGCPFEEVQITNQHLGKSKSETMWSESAILCKPVDTQLRFAKAAGRKQISGRRVGCNGLKPWEIQRIYTMSHLCLNECLIFLKICVFWEDHGGSQIRLVAFQSY